jgi:hypothetical protein
VKKAMIVTILILVVLSSAITPAFAQKGKQNIKGEVISIESGTITIESNKGELFVIAIPDGIDVSDIQKGDSVLVKAVTAEDGSLVIDSIKKVGNGSGNDDNANKGNGNGDDEDKDKPEGFQDNSAFCAEDKQDKPHPLVPKLAERYGVSEEWVMEKFCEGYSIGAIMLAIKTSQMEGATATPNELLTNRAAGNGWGLIWKELGLIGSEKNGHSPPGLLKKPDHSGPD